MPPTPLISCPMGSFEHLVSERIGNGLGLHQDYPRATAETWVYRVIVPVFDLAFSLNRRLPASCSPAAIGRLLVSCSNLHEQHKRHD